MCKIKILFLFLIFFCLTIPAHLTYAQDSSSETEAISSENKSADNSNFQLDITSIEKNKGDKKKDKINMNEKFFINLLLNILTLLIITIFIYYPANRQMDNVFTLFMFNIVIYMLTFVLNEIKISMGAAFGLFAVFSMLRYRTIGISTKDMTYLFIFIAVGLISAIRLEYYELAIINGLIIIFTFILGGNLIFKRETSKRICYENIELIKPENYNLLMDDLKKRTGLDIHRIVIGRINFLKDSASIKVFYYEKKQNNKIK